MKRAELALRKELALAHLQIARTEMTLARVQKPDSLAVLSSAVDLASSVLAVRGFGAWSRYALFGLSVAHVVLGAMAVGSPQGPTTPRLESGVGRRRPSPA